MVTVHVNVAVAVIVLGVVVVVVIGVGGVWRCGELPQWDEEAHDECVPHRPALFVW